MKMVVSRRLSAFAFVAIAAAGLSGSVKADFYSLRPGPGSSQDAAISGARPTVNQGSGAGGLFGSFQDVSNLRMMFHFDLPSFRPDETIVQSRFTVTEVGAFVHHNVYRAHLMRLTEAWDQADVTWNDRLPGQTWSTPGGTFAEEWASETFIAVSGHRESQQVQFDITALTAAWARGDFPNYGFILVPEVLYITPNGIDSPTNNYTSFASGEHADVNFRPLYEIVTTAVPTPGSVAMLGLGGLFVLPRRRRIA